MKHSQANQGNNGWPWLLHVAGPMALGTVVYAVWRPTTLRMFGWAKTLGCEDRKSTRLNSSHT